MYVYIYIYIHIYIHTYSQIILVKIHGKFAVIFNLTVDGLRSAGRSHRPGGFKTNPEMNRTPTWKGMENRHFIAG